MVKYNERLGLLSPNPILLSTVFLQAATAQSYAFAERHADQLWSWITAKNLLLKQNRSYTFCSEHSSNEAYAFVAASTEPLEEGYVSEDHTRLILIAPKWSLESASCVPASTIDGFADATDRDGLNFDPLIQKREIDSQFLLNNIVSSSSAQLSADNSTSVKVSHSSGRLIRNAVAIDVLTSTSLHLKDTGEASFTLFATADDLTQVGVFEGEWALVSSETARSPHLVRVRLGSDQWLDGKFAVSRILLNNIKPTTGGKNNKYLTLQPCTLGRSITPLPVVKSLTFARVASPASTRRDSQMLFLNALRENLDRQNVIIKEHDLIALNIQYDLLRLMHKDVNSIPEETRRLSRGSHLPKTHVQYKVTHLDLGSSTTSTRAPSSNFQELARMGELGCRIDALETQVVQSGVEHLGLLPLDNDACTLTGAAALELKALVGALLDDAAVNYSVHPSLLLKGLPGVGKAHISRLVAEELGIHFYELNCHDMAAELPHQAKALLSSRLEHAAHCSPCIILLRNINSLANSELSEDNALIAVLDDFLQAALGGWKLTGHPAVVVGSVSDQETVPPSLFRMFKHQISVEAPADHERLAILSHLLQGCSVSPDVSLQRLSLETASFVAGDLQHLVNDAKHLAIERSLNQVSLVSGRSITSAGIFLSQVDFDTALKQSRSLHGQSIGAPQIPSVSWEDVGGLGDVKADILDTIQLPLEHPELFRNGVKRRSGILLYGPPGTGKTMLAKAVATSCSLNFLSVKGPELLNMYVGESEGNVRKIFQRARDASPCVIFFDELDSIAPARGNQGDSGGVMDRIVSQLLAELDGVAAPDSMQSVFVIGATNRPDLLDTALLRPGRFDRLLYLGVSDTHEGQTNILRALTRRFRLEGGLNIADVAKQCPLNLTGADFYALCADAMLEAMLRKAREVDAIISSLQSSDRQKGRSSVVTPQYYLSELGKADDVAVVVKREDFSTATENLHPSVSLTEMEHYKSVQRHFGRDREKA